MLWILHVAVRSRRVTTAPTVIMAAGTRNRGGGLLNPRSPSIAAIAAYGAWLLPPDAHSGAGENLRESGLNGGGAVGSGGGSSHAAGEAATILVFYR
jgi:hypothetical protein